MLYGCVFAHRLAKPIVFCTASVQNLSHLFHSIICARLGLDLVLDDGVFLLAGVRDLSRRPAADLDRPLSPLLGALEECKFGH